MTTYIESKLNPDGTYDHSEVIEAVRNGAHLDFLHPTIEEWEPIGDPTWACYIKYRAVIEDKPSYPQFFKQDSERFHNQLHEENRMEAVAVIGDKQPTAINHDVSDWFKSPNLAEELEVANSLWENSKPSVFLAAHIAKKFQSGNSIPVERITLTRAEVNEVFPGLLK